MFAVGLDGTILVNAAAFDNVANTQEALARALEEPGEVFIGVVLEAKDRSILAKSLKAACSEACGFVIGRRQRKQQASR